MRIIGGKTPLKSDTWPPDKKVVLTQKCWQCDTCLPWPVQTDKIWFISTELDWAVVWVRRENFNFKCFLIRLGLACNGLLPQYVPNTSSLLLPACGNWGLLGLIEGRLPVMDSCLAGRDVMLLLSWILKLKSLSQPSQWCYEVTLIVMV